MPTPESHGEAGGRLSATNLWRCGGFSRWFDCSREARFMYDDLDPSPAPVPQVRRNIGREGRAWTGEEALGRWELTPEKFEMDGGKLL